MRKADRLFVTCDYAPVTGGQSAYFTNLWSGLDSSRDLFLLPGICRPAAHGLWATFFPLPRGETWMPRLLRMAILVACMLRLALVHRPREMHVGQLVAGGIAALLVNRLLGIPYVLYVFGSDLLEFSRTPLRTAIVRAIITRSARVITISRFTESVIRRVCESARVSIVSPGVEERFFATDETAAQRLRHDLRLRGKTVLLTVGRLVRRKGHAVVIRALHDLVSRLPGLHYLIVGDGPEREAILRLAKELRVDEHVTLRVNVPDADLPSCYRAADIFVMVSSFLESQGDAEGYGIVYLEANACGIPVIAGRSGGAVDAVRENVSGIFVDDPSDAGQVAAAIQHLAEDGDLRRRLGSGALDWARQNRWDTRREQWREETTS